MRRFKVGDHVVVNALGKRTAMGVWNGAPLDKDHEIFLITSDTDSGLYQGAMRLRTMTYWLVRPDLYEVLDEKG